MRTLGTIGVIALEALGFYLAFAFVIADLNAVNWGFEVRGKMIIFLFFTACATSLIRHLK